jgi:glycerate 2-kinase
VNLIKNFSDLARTEKRKIALSIVEAGLVAIQPEQVLRDSFVLTDNILKIKDERFDLSAYKRVFLVGFGKGSAAMAEIIEEVLGKRLTAGYVIDTKEKNFSKIQFTLGTHPLPSEENIKFTEKVLQDLENLEADDLVIVVICGGGSALFESPFSLEYSELEKIFKSLINSGTTITETNVVRKHLSKVKGGNFAKHLYPATVASLIFSDVPGNDLSVVASGPTVSDTSTLEDVYKILQDHNISPDLIPKTALVELPHEERFFEKVKNIIILSNMVALTAMQKKANDLGYKSFIYSDKVQGEADAVGKELIEKTPEGQILLAGGETTVRVTGTGKGGRNQTLVLAALDHINEKTIILAINSDGIDYYHYAGAIGDKNSLQKAEELDLNRQTFLANNDSSAFFDKTGDGILTDKLESNVSDLIMVLKI